MPSPQENYETFKAQLRLLNNEEIIEAFNRQIGNNGWTSSRGSYLGALSSEFERRGFDYSSVGNEAGLSLANKVKIENNVIVPLTKRKGPSVEMIIST